MEERIWKIRTWLYAIGISAIVLSTICKYTSGHANEIEYDCDSEESDDSADSNDFWPPDMIPHPNLPEPKPNDGMS